MIICESRLPRLPGLRDFRRLPDFDDDHERNNVTLDFVETRIDFAHVMLLHALAQTFEAQRFRVDSFIDAENVQHNSWCRPVIALTNNHPITNDDQ